MEEAEERAGGICECHRVPQIMQILAGRACGAPLGPGNINYEHIICTELGGDNSVENCAVLTRTCWRLKTSRYDQPAIAEAKRRARSHKGIVVPSRNPLPGGRRDPRKRTVGGGVIDRATGERWGGRTNG
jgi:hypothetical protein